MIIVSLAALKPPYFQSCHWSLSIFIFIALEPWQAFSKARGLFQNLGWFTFLHWHYVFASSTFWSYSTLGATSVSVLMGTVKLVLEIMVDSEAQLSFGWNLRILTGAKTVWTISQWPVCFLLSLNKFNLLVFRWQLAGAEADFRLPQVCCFLLVHLSVF